MTDIGAFDAKTRLSELLRKVEAGESFTITRHGRPVARLVPAGTDEEAGRLRRHAVLNELEALRKKNALGIGWKTARDEGRRF